jgi:hypothetical protein
MENLLSRLVLIVFFGSIIFIVLIILRKSGGVWIWTQIYLKKKGIKSSAVIIDSMNKSKGYSLNRVRQYLYTVVMDVKDPVTGSSYKVMGKYMDSLFSFLSKKGQNVPVLIHPLHKDLVIVDFRAIDKIKKQDFKQNNNLDKNRLEHLMKN